MSTVLLVRVAFSRTFFFIMWEMMDLPLTLHVLLLLMSLSTAVWACPDGCKCAGTSVQCIGLSNFPMAIPSSTTKIYLVKCSFNSLEPDDLTDFSNSLGSLTLSGNELLDLPEALFQNLQKLEVLQLNSNKLLVILPVETLHPLTKLQQLSLSGIFLNLPQLSQISLYENQLESLDDLTASEEVLLQQNPWRCDKDILPLRDWLKQHPSKANQTLVVCETPSSLSGEMIALLPDENLISLSSTQEPVLTSTEKRKRPHTPPTKQKLCCRLQLSKSTPRTFKGELIELVTKPQRQQKVPIQLHHKITSKQLCF
uniref:LRRCT domain-containing protein n=1 Tax=Amphilophus citrinellus TaxID=61819 RepID=A0A3Q0S0B8_AMPCI